MIRRVATIAFLSAGTLVSVACKDKDDNGNTNDASVGAGGFAGAHGGSAGVGGNAATAGTSGSAGRGGTAGSGGSGGTSGSSGRAGAAGSSVADASVDAGKAPSDAGADAGSVASFDAEAWLAILDTVNKGEIAQGNLASVNATAATVKTFAAEMVAAHMEGIDNDDATANALGVGRRPNALSARLDAQSAAVVNQLHSLSGAAYDRTYMQAQVSQHQAVLALLDTGISANGGNASSSPPTIDAGRPRTLLALLVATRAVVTEHLTMAQSILSSLP